MDPTIPLLNYQKPPPVSTKYCSSDRVDEVWRYLQRKNKLWIWRAYCRITPQLFDWGCGGVIAGLFSWCWAGYGNWGVRVFFADHWEEAYGACSTEFVYSD